MTAAPYDNENVFAKILRGEIPSHRVFEDEVAIAFMDVMPQGRGHVLVVPKTAARNILDVEPEQLAALIVRVQKVARAAKAAMGADGLTILQFNEPAGGQTVFHLHVHVIPRFAGVPLEPHGNKVADAATLKEQAEAIAAHL